MRYLDTSLIIAALTIEPGSDRAQRALSQGGEPMMISDWSLTELSSALSIKLRTGQITADERASHSAAIQRFTMHSFVKVPVTAADFRTAAIYADSWQAAIRAGDALHLAIAAARGAVVWTLDKGMAEAGPPLGVRVRLI